MKSGIERLFTAIITGLASFDCFAVGLLLYAKGTDSLGILSIGFGIAFLAYGLFRLRQLKKVLK